MGACTGANGLSETNLSSALARLALAHDEHQDVFSLDEPASRPSGLSTFFSSYRDCAWAEEQTDAELDSVADASVRSLHLASKKHRPCVHSLHCTWPPCTRRETMIWVVKAFDVMQLTDQAVFQTALLLDRFYGSATSSRSRVGLDNQLSQTMLLACVCVALKVGEQSDHQQPSKNLVAHLGHDQVPFSEVMASELKLLSSLHYVVGTPTCLECLEALSARLLQYDVRLSSLANFLLHWVLGEAGLYYKYPPAILAAAILALSLSSLSAPSEAFAVLIEDFTLQVTSVEEQSLLRGCCTEVHMHWVKIRSMDTLMVRHDPSVLQYAQCLHTKFMTASRHHVASFRPPAQLPEAFQLALAQPRRLETAGKARP